MAHPKLGRCPNQKWIRTLTTQESPDFSHGECQNVFPGLRDNEHMHALIEKQLNGLLEIFWAFEAWDPTTKAYNDVRKTVERRLASVKNNRIYSDEPQDGLVCTVCGMREALHEGNIDEHHRIGQMRRIIEQTWRKRALKYQEKKRRKRLLDQKQRTAVRRLFDKTRRPGNLLRTSCVRIVPFRRRFRIEKQSEQFGKQSVLCNHHDGRRRHGKMDQRR